MVDVLVRKRLNEQPLHGRDVNASIELWLKISGRRVTKGGRFLVR